MTTTARWPSAPRAKVLHMIQLLLLPTVLILLKLVQAQTSTTTSTTCLPDAVDPSLRKDVVVDGETMPLGIIKLFWQSASMNADIFRIIASEVLGYNAEFSKMSSSVVVGMWSLVGCQSDVYDESDLSLLCDLSGNVVSTDHMMLEAWDFWMTATVEAMEVEPYKSRAPTRLGGEHGNLGWEGTTGTFFPQDVLDTAALDGVAINSYIAYNASNFNPSKYFDSLEDINTTDFYTNASRCVDYWSTSGDELSRYYAQYFPEDTDGIETFTDAQGNERLRGRCEDGVWWLSPACRSDPSTCIPWISVQGIGYDLIWQKATYYNMPIALASTNHKRVDLVLHNKVMAYTWSPDATFAGQALTPLLFPVNDLEQDANNFFVTQFRPVTASKWAHQDLEKEAPRVWLTATRMNLTKSMMIELLEHTYGHGLTSEEGACHFLREHRDWWEGWVTPNTNCQAGMGLFVNDKGDYECEWCPRATASLEGTVADSGAATRYCVACEIGTYQDNTQSTECVKCAPGTYTSTNSSEVCTNCRVGTYQPSEGSSMCLECPAGRSTRIRGATSLEECVCEEGTYEPVGAECASELDSCSCTQCMTGLDCPLGSRLETWLKKVQEGLEVDEDRNPVPQVKSGYYSLPEQPESIFRCAEEDACPGGDPGSCSGGRIALTCSRCPSDFFLTQDGYCKQCEGWELQLALACAVLGTVALTLGHVAVNWPTSMSSQWTMTTVFLAGMGVTTCLTFNIYANLDFEAIAPLVDLFELMKVMAFDMKVLRAACLTGSDRQVVKYSTKLAAVPASFLALCLGAFLFSMVPKWRSRASFTCAGLQNSMGMLFTIFFISVSLLSLEAFRCDAHPNGKTSLTSDLSVLCWESNDHGQLVFLSICAILVYPLPFLTCTALMTYNYSAWTRRCGASFVLRSRFLFNRMGPGNAAFAFWYNVRNFAMTLVPVVAANEYSLQVNLLMAIFLVWLLAQMNANPWRFAILNRFDAFTSAIQILMLNNFATLSASGLSQSDNPDATAGWTIIGLFASIMIGILVLGISRCVRRWSKQKEYAIFLSHHKDTSGRFARQLKLMLTSLTTKKVFLDVDELSNLDNLNFTVRSNTEQVLVLMTEEALTRLWIAVEVSSAVLNKVPVHLVAASSSFKGSSYFSEEWLAAVPSMWAPTDVMEFHKIGLDLDMVESSYRFLSTLRVLPMHMESQLDKQWSQVHELMRSQLALAVKQKEWHWDPEHHVIICYDPNCCAQACSAKILAMLFHRRHWRTTLQEDVTAESAIRLEGTVALALMGKSLLENPDCVGLLSVLHFKSLPLVTVLAGGEAFSKPEPGYFDNIRFGFVYDKEQLETIFTYLPRTTLDTVANALELLHKILAWRFSPQESEPLVLTEFDRIWQRADVERVKPRPSSSQVSHNKSLGSSVSLDVSHDPTGCGSLGSWSESPRPGLAENASADKSVFHFQLASV